ncbi:hypothetical protein OAO01_05710 [Oligoflexia bacterium]|nr:hypothetical protein [Oligoflexia bacterium]
MNTFYSRCIILLLALAYVVAGSNYLTSAAYAVPRFEAKGIRIVDAPSDNNDQMKAFNWFPGTSVSLLLAREKGGIIELDRSKSSLTVFKDNKGKDLLTAPKLSKFSSSGFEMMPKISDDGKACLFEIKASAVPSKSATGLRIEGTVQVKTATTKTTDKVNNLELKVGKTFKAGSVTLTVAKVGKPAWSMGNKNFAVTFEAKQDLSDIAEIRFLGSDGKVLDASKGSSSRSGFGDSVTINWEYLLPQALDKVNLEVARWTDLKDETIPLALTVGLGL